MRPVDEIIVHCTATPEGRPVTVSEIDAWHRARGWSGIGYHRVVTLGGDRLDGRPLTAVGAHVAGRNARTIGVVYVGGLATNGSTAKDTRTPAQKSALEAELYDLLVRFPSIRKISGHRDYAVKACPCFDATTEYRPLLVPVSQPFTPQKDASLQRGDTGPEVRAWRAELASWRKLIQHPWPVPEGDVFDHTIELVTIEFQKARGVVADGRVGPQTREEMTLALAGQPPFQAIPKPTDAVDYKAAIAKLQEALTLLGAP